MKTLDPLPSGDVLILDGDKVIRSTLTRPCPQHNVLCQEEKMSGWLCTSTSTCNDLAVVGWECGTGACEEHR